MQSRRWAVVAGVVLVVIVVAIWFLRRGREGAPAVDLVEQFPSAEKRSGLPQDKALSIVNLTVNGETRRGIFAHPPSRITWKLTIPQDAWLRTSLALNPEMWDKESDGVLFRIGVSDGRKYDELLSQHVDPHNAAGDRRWLPVSIDLSAYARQEVSLIFNTNTSLPGRGDDPRNDWAVWGEPQIYVAR